MEWGGILIIEKTWLQKWNFKMKFQYDTPPPIKFYFSEGRDYQAPYETKTVSCSLGLSFEDTFWPEKSSPSSSWQQLSCFDLKKFVVCSTYERLPSAVARPSEGPPHIVRSHLSFLPHGPSRLLPSSSRSVLVSLTHLLGRTGGGSATRSETGESEERNQSDEGMSYKYAHQRFFLSCNLYPMLSHNSAELLDSLEDSCWTHPC